VVEVAEAVELAEALDRVDRERLAVPARDLQQRFRLDRRLEVDVQLDLRVGDGFCDQWPPARGGETALSPERNQRLATRGKKEEVRGGTMGSPT
jgi:hypothetical protein